MFILGWLLLFLALPLFIGHFIAPEEKRNGTWLRLGIIMAIVGAILAIFGR